MQPGECSRERLSIKRPPPPPQRPTRTFLSLLFFFNWSDIHLTFYMFTVLWDQHLCPVPRWFHRPKCDPVLRTLICLLANPPPILI